MSCNACGGLVAILLGKVHRRSTCGALSWAGTALHHPDKQAHAEEHHRGREQSLCCPGKRDVPYTVVVSVATVK